MKNHMLRTLGASLNLPVLVFLGLFATVGTATANVVTFDTVGGSNGDPFASLTENGVTVTSSAGFWQKGFNVGNPIPSIFTFGGIASVTEHNPVAFLVF